MSNHDKPAKGSKRRHQRDNRPPQGNGVPRGPPFLPEYLPFFRPAEEDDERGQLAEQVQALDLSTNSRSGQPASQPPSRPGLEAPAELHQSRLFRRTPGNVHENGRPASAASTHVLRACEWCKKPVGGDNCSGVNPNFCCDACFESYRRRHFKRRAFCAHCGQRGDWELEISSADAPLHELPERVCRPCLYRQAGKSAGPAMADGNNGGEQPPNRPRTLTVSPSTSVTAVSGNDGRPSTLRVEPSRRTPPPVAQQDAPILGHTLRGMFQSPAPAAQYARTGMSRDLGRPSTAPPQPPGSSAVRAIDFRNVEGDVTITARPLISNQNPNNPQGTGPRPQITERHGSSDYGNVSDNRAQLGHGQQHGGGGMMMGAPISRPQRPLPHVNMNPAHQQPHHLRTPMQGPQPRFPHMPPITPPRPHVNPLYNLPPSQIQRLVNEYQQLHQSSIGMSGSRYPHPGQGVIYKSPREFSQQSRPEGMGPPVPTSMQSSTSTSGIHSSSSGHTNPLSIQIGNLHGGPTGGGAAPPGIPHQAGGPSPPKQPRAEGVQPIPYPNFPLQPSPLMSPFQHNALLNHQLFQQPLRLPLQNEVRWSPLDPSFPYPQHFSSPASSSMSSYGNEPAMSPTTPAILHYSPFPGHQPHLLLSQVPPGGGMGGLPHLDPIPPEHQRQISVAEEQPSSSDIDTSEATGGGDNRRRCAASSTVRSTTPKPAARRTYRRRTSPPELFVTHTDSATQTEEMMFNPPAPTVAPVATTSSSSSEIRNQLSNARPGPVTGASVIRQVEAQSNHSILKLASGKMSTPAKSHSNGTETSGSTPTAAKNDGASQNDVNRAPTPAVADVREEGRNSAGAEAAVGEGVIQGSFGGRPAALAMSNSSTEATSRAGRSDSNGNPYGSRNQMNPLLMKYPSYVKHMNHIQRREERPDESTDESDSSAEEERPSRFESIDSP